MNNEFNIFNTKIDRVNFIVAFDKAKRYLKDEQVQTIVTPNPEILLKAEKNHSLRDAINDSDLRLPDGAGLVLASKLLKIPIPERVTGVDFLEVLLLYSQKHHHNVHVLLHEGGLTESRVLYSYFEKKFPKINISCHEVRTSYLLSGHILDDIAQVEPDLLIITFGSPFQEEWLHRNKRKLKNVNVAIAVGGAFDMLTGTILRAPQWVQRLSLEWLWRIFVQPEHKIIRLKRIFNAVIVFGYKVLLLKFRIHYVYRKNVMCVVYKDSQKILLAHKLPYKDERTTHKGYWAFPQGGVDKNEPLIHAAKRELREEVGIKSIGRITRSSQINKYRWQPYRRNIYSNRYTGQRQHTFFMKFTGDDDEIQFNNDSHEQFDGYVWLTQKELIKKIDPARRGIAEKLLLEFNMHKVYTQ